MRYFLFTIMTAISANSLADHTLSEFEGEWYSSIFPQSTRYMFYGLQAAGKLQYVIRHVRPTPNGECVGSGIINLSSGHVRTVEVCPSRDGNPVNDSAFFAVWQLANEHGDLHLKGGYYGQGSATFHEENLDKEPHR